MLTQDVDIPANSNITEETCLLINGLALVISLGTPQGMKTLGDFSNIFTGTVFKMGSRYRRTDVVIDRYQDESIKTSIRTKRKQCH